MPAGEREGRRSHVPQGPDDILKARPISLHELALLFDERPRDLEDDLQHLFRSLRKDPLQNS